MGDPMLKFFDFEAFPSHVQGLAANFDVLATSICETIVPGPERTVVLRKLLESRDAALRAKVYPGE